MATPFPRDQFDDVPPDRARVGAHRASPRPGRGWIGFAWAALATGVLVALGLYWMVVVAGRVTLDIPVFQGPTPSATPTPTPTPTPTAEPITDPSTIASKRNISITVLNGTPRAELQQTVGNSLEADGWPIGTVAVASARDVEKTLVYYSDPANEDVARGVVLALGIGDVRLSDAFLGAPVTLVLGADFPTE